LKDINPIRELDWAHCCIPLREKKQVTSKLALYTAQKKKKRKKKERRKRKVEQRENERGNVLQREYG